MSVVLALPDEAATEALGRRLADAARPGDVIALAGPLGAGKSTLARAFVRRLAGAAEEVPSPTFTLVQQYPSPRGTVWHFDLFRLKQPEEALELGLDDAFAEGIALIEWPERLAGMLPARRLLVDLAVDAAGDTREARIEGWDDRLTRLGGAGQSREAMRESFLAAQGWGGAARAALTGDASFRRYWRVTLGARRAVLMDVPPDKLDIAAFQSVDAHLRALGYSAPEIWASDPKSGFVLLEDLGDDTLAARLDAGDEPGALFGLAVDWLIDLHKRGRDALPKKLPGYDDARLLEEVSRFLLWYVPATVGQLDARAVLEFDSIWRALLPVMRDVPATLVYRDFHVENLMKLERPGVAGLGLLDFQDAVTGPITYDLASLLEDARRDLPEPLIAAMTERYLAAFPATDRRKFHASWAAMAAHRHVKCLGLFVRLAKRDAKPAYLVHIPRLWRLLGRSLAHPALAPLARWLDAHLPDQRRIVPP